MSEEFVLVDTSFLVALLDARDSLHQRAEEIEKELASLKLKYKKGSNTATVALSRKLLEIVYKVWKEKRPNF